jgi:hypothetical protein
VEPRQRDSLTVHMFGSVVSPLEDLLLTGKYLGDYLDLLAVFERH